MPAVLLEGCLKIRQTGDPTAAGSSAGCWGLHREATGRFPPLANPPRDPSRPRPDVTSNQLAGTVTPMSYASATDSRFLGTLESWLSSLPEIPVLIRCGLPARSALISLSRIQARCGKKSDSSI